jgi:DNA-binding transcriptional LysR family regulator
MSGSPSGLAVLRQVKALEEELEAEVMHRSRRVHLA